VFERLSDGSAIYIPVSLWYTRLGRLIQSTGIEPDIEVSLTNEDRLVGIDSQLVEVYDYLDEQLPDFR
jgi:C-terminal processing protease CtpA/Prc